MNIYVASSWRNAQQKYVVRRLKRAGHEVYDFRKPHPNNKGFHWSDIDIDWRKWSVKAYRYHLDHPIAKQGFMLDFDAMQWAECFVGVMPFGVSASLEMGWAAGNNKKTILLIGNAEPELMVKMLDHVCVNMAEVLEALE